MKLSQRSIVSLALLTMMTMLTATRAFAHEPGAHIHGVATLQVAIEGGTVQLDLDTPLDNVLGFEHEPRTAKEKQAVQAMANKLRHPETLFALTPTAQCTPGTVELNAPVVNLGKADKNDMDKDGDHADLEATMTFNCRAPSALKDLEVKLFDAFPRVHQLNVQVAGPRGQSAAELSAKQRRLSW